MIATFLSSNLWAQAPQFSIALAKHSLINDCLLAIPSPDEDVLWNLKCPFAEFQEKIKEQVVESSSDNEAIKLLLARVLIQETLKVRVSLFLSSDPQLDKLLAPKPLGPDENAESVFLRFSENSLALVEALLTPSITQQSKSLYPIEAGILYAQALGDFFRFENLAQSLDNELAFLWKESRSRQWLFQNIPSWIDQFPKEAKPLMAGIRREILKQKSTEITGKDERELRLWLRSLEYGEAVSNKVQRENLLAIYRQLWIVYPKQDFQEQIRLSTKKLGISQYFIAPSLRQMSLKELMTRSEAALKFVQGEAALDAIRQVLKLPPSSAKPEELWEALDLHIRVLRLLDRRPEIPGVLSQYLKRGKFLDIPSDKTKLEDFFKRLHKLARWQWSYDKSSVALSTLDKIIALNLNAGTQFQVGMAYYVRARIMEQGEDKLLARKFLEESIAVLKGPPVRHADLLEDLLWRRFFIALDHASSTQNFEELPTLLDELKSYIVSAEDDGSRWEFWKAQIHLLKGETQKAITFFENTYKKDPLSYYSTVSGWELTRLGVTPKNWRLPSAIDFWQSADLRKEPSWRDFWSEESGKSSGPEYDEHSKILGLARIGWYSQARNYLVPLERKAYAVAGKTQWTAYKRKRYLRDTAWLRFSLSDYLGSLRMSEIIRVQFKGDLDSEDLAFLYPLPYFDLIQEHSQKQGIDPWYVVSLIRQESAFNPRAKSFANALGLMQMIPPVAMADAKKLKMENFKVEDLYDPPTAIRMGTYHLTELYKYFGGSWIAATAGYNAGRPPVKSWLDYYSSTLPYAFIERISFAETRKYVRSILRNYLNYSRIYRLSGEDSKNPDWTELMKMPTQVPGKVIQSSDELGNIGDSPAL